MKTSACILGLMALVWNPAANAAESPGAKTGDRVGVYDSRIVAFAHFWSEPNRKERDALIESAKAAKAAGETARFFEYDQALKAAQDRSHLQVFSSAPADEAMAALKDRLPAIQKEVGATRFVSKWDEAALKGIPEASRVDITDRLAREFSPDEKRLKMIEQMKQSQPVPLEKAKKMLLAGEL